MYTRATSYTRAQPCGKNICCWRKWAQLQTIEILEHSHSRPISCHGRRLCERKTMKTSRRPSALSPDASATVDKIAPEITIIHYVLFAKGIIWVSTVVFSFLLSLSLTFLSQNETTLEVQIALFVWWNLLLYSATTSSNKISFRLRKKLRPFWAPHD